MDTDTDAGMGIPSRSGLALAEHWLLIDRPERALQELDRLPADQAVCGQASRLRAAALHDLEQYDAACRAAQTGLAQDGPQPWLLGVLGSARHALGRYEEAERAYLDALALDPTDAFLLCRYARLCLEVAQVGKAERLVERAASHNPQNPEVERARVLIAFARSRDTEAFRRSRKALALDPDDSASRALHGMTAANVGRVGTAYHCIRHAVASDPSNAGLTEAAWEARLRAHWLLYPLRPFARLGPIQVWLLAVAIMVVLSGLGLTSAAGVFGLLYLVFVIYSWTAPPIVRRLLRRAR